MTNIFVGNLSFSTTEEELRELFSAYGDVSAARIIIDRQTGRSKGFGFVEMDTDSADTAITRLNDSELGGRKIRVNEAQERTERPRSNNNRGGGNYRNSY